ncbi:MAG TPA: efflux RND transporter periplasmic adaptor subunit [Calditrichaeota bacterium]|nr:efflux RND transporter periplasmic adaptor subunit [Calditrichota bacterium]
MEKTKYANRMLPFIKVFFLFFLLLRCADPTEEKDKSLTEKTNSAKSAVRVVTKEAFIGKLQKTIRSEGRAQAWRQTPLIFEKNGYLQKLNYREGQYVKKGALIAMLQNEKEAVAVQENRAALIKAITEYAAKMPNRQSALEQLQKRFMSSPPDRSEEEGGSGIDDLDTLAERILSGKNRSEALMAVSGLLQSYTAYKRSLINYNRTFFYAPFSGVLGDLSARAGEYVLSGQSAAVLYDLSRIKIEVDVLEEEGPLVAPASPCRIRFPALPGRTFSGKVYEKNVSLDEEKHVIRLTVLLSDGRQRIAPGMTAIVDIQTALEEESLLVPKEAVLERDGRYLVFVVRDSTANWCYISPGESNEQYMQVLDSEFHLKAGEPVIVEGQFTLAHGAKVKIKDHN